MKILFTLASLGSGGAERVVTLLANRMNAMGHQVEIACLKYDDVYYQTDDGVKVVLAEHLGDNLPELFWLRKHIRQGLDPSAMTWKRNLLKRLLLPYADWLVVQTRTIKEFFPKSIQKKTSVIYNPVNITRPQSLTPSPSPKGEGGIQSEKKMNRIISVARLFPQKNQAMMIRAFAKVADEFPDWQLVIFGEGPLRAELESLVSSFKLQDRVFLPGRTEHVIEELRKSKIFCMSSDYEGMSNSMIEAICVGLPIVSTKVSGTDELIEDGVNGYLVEIGDEKGMTEALDKLIQNEDLMKQMGEANLKKASFFRMDTIVDQWFSIIYRVLSQS